jgi:hypothetical protein
LPERAVPVLSGFWISCARPSSAAADPPVFASFTLMNRSNARCIPYRRWRELALEILTRMPKKKKLKFFAQRPIAGLES